MPLISWKAFIIASKNTCWSLIKAPRGNGARVSGPPSSAEQTGTCQGHVCRASCACMVGGRVGVGAAWAGEPMHSCWETLVGRDPTKVMMVCRRPVSFLPIPLCFLLLRKLCGPQRSREGPSAGPYLTAERISATACCPGGNRRALPQARRSPCLSSCPGPGLSLHSLLYVVRVTLKIFWESSGRPK